MFAECCGRATIVARRQPRQVRSYRAAAFMSGRSRGAKRPKFCKSFAPRKQRAQGRPGARCTRGLMCNIVRSGAHEHTGSAETLRPSLRNGFTAYAVISPATNSSVCHRRLRIKICLSPVGPTRLRKLDTSNGCRNHTVLPYATTRLRQKASPGKAPFVRVPPIAHESMRLTLQLRFTPDAAASTASPPQRCDAGQRPPERDGMTRIYF